VHTAIFDADSHLMETPDWLGAFADPSVRERLAPLGLEGAGAGAAELMAQLPELWESQRTEPVGPEVLKGPKGWKAPGALDAGVRTRVLDALEIDAQLVFPTFALGHFARDKDPDVLYGGADALNRGMVSFCAADPRLKAVGYLPLNDPARALDTLNHALDEGVAAVWVPSDAPGDSRSSIIPRSGSSPAWRSTVSSNIIPICAVLPLSSARHGCRECCATWTMPCARSRSSSPSCRN
jgi:hypothetical protein